MIPESKETSDITVNFKGGGSFTNLPPVLSSDGESVFVGWKSSILEYNTTTGKLIHEYKGLSGNIIGFACHVYETYPCIIACSENGHIILWKTLTHYKLFEKKLPITNVKTFHIVSTEIDQLNALISFISKVKNTIRFTLANLIEKKSNFYTLELNRNQKFTVGVSKNYFAVINQSTIFFIKLDTFDKISKVTIATDKTLTCIACHKYEEVVIAGDTLGRVICWQNIFGRDKIQSIFHWHTLPVQSVCFSPSGSYFYSGGGENVLVKWQFDDINDKRFVPRIAAEICQISVADNNMLLAVATKDNAIRIFNNTLNQTTLIQHLVLGSHYECGIVYDARTRSLMMNGNLGCVQFYNPDDMSLLYNVDVISQNKRTNERDCIMINTEITKLAASKNGLWMATVEERRDLEYQYEIRLKFWRFDEKIQMFALNTAVDYPHEKSINSIMFQPVSGNEDLRCVTVGNDAKFKLWQLEDITTVYKKDYVWRCKAVGFYRDLPCNALSFSIDGSLMATGFRSILTIWVPTTCELKSSLVHPVHSDPIKHIQFGYGPNCHLVVSASAKQLSVWNLLTLSMLWTVPVTVCLLIADPSSDYMAVFTQDRNVFVFTPNSDVPIYSSREKERGLNLAKKDKILAAAFVPTKFHNDSRLKWYERTNIYFMASNNELYSISGMDIIIDINDFNFSALELESVPAMTQPATSVSAVERAIPTKHLYERDAGHVSLKKYLMGSTHTQLPIRLLCHTLLRSLVLEKTDFLNADS